MKRLSNFVLLCVAALLLTGFERSACASDWYENWGSATAAARRTGQPLIVIFEHEGCPECARMNASLANKKSDDALQNAVKAKLEFTEEPNLTSQFGVSVTPTLLMFNPASGFSNYVYRHEGSMGVNSIVSLGQRVDTMAGRFQKPDEKTVASSDGAHQTVQQTPPSSQDTTASAKPAKKTSTKSTKSARKVKHTKSTSPQSSYSDNPAWYNPWSTYSQPYNRATE